MLALGTTRSVVEVSAFVTTPLRVSPRLESASQALPRDGAVALAAGRALAERGLWGKARTLLEQAGADLALPAPARRSAWIALAELATRDGDAALAARCYERAARQA